MATNQPTWEFVRNLGDVSAPLEHGGLFLYRDASNVYGYEMTRLVSIGRNKIQMHHVYLGRCKVVEGYLVPYAYEKDWPFEPSAYQEWFAKSLDAVSECFGVETEELVAMLGSEDGLLRAHAYRMVLDYHGWDNGDGYPEEMSRRDAKRRFSKELSQ